MILLLVRANAGEDTCSSSSVCSSGDRDSEWSEQGEGGEVVIMMWAVRPKRLHTVLSLNLPEFVSTKSSSDLYGQLFETAKSSRL